MKLLPFNTFPKTTNKLYTHVDGTIKYMLKSYCGPDRFARYRREKLSLEHWNKAGFNVPQVYDKKIDSIQEPYLVISFVEGTLLRQYLSANSHTYQDKLKTLTKLFEQISHRHDFAIQTNDRYLIHYDPSTGNIICTEKSFYFIDFETPAKKRKTVLELAAVEVATTCKWIVRDLGIEFLEEVMKLLVDSYKNHRFLLRLIVKRTTGRPFQFYHRWRDRRRKTANPKKEVTKYDIADVLSDLLSR